MKILVPYDGSPQAQDALDHAITSFPDAEITALYVIDPASQGYASTEEFPTIAGGEWADLADQQAEEVLEDAQQRTDHDLTTDSVVGRPGEAIVKYAQDHAIDQIVMGSHGRTGVARLLLGSVAERVVRRSPVPVTVVR